MRNRINELELRALHHISLIIGQALNINQALDAILEVLSEDLAMKHGAVTLKKADSEKLAITASHGLTTEEKKRGVYRFDEGVTGLVFRTCEPVVVPDISQEPLFLNKTGARNIEKEGIAFIGAPIILHGAPVGVLSVDRLFDSDISFEEDVRFLTIVAALIAQVVSLNSQVQAREENLLRANRSLKADLSEKSRNFFDTAKSKSMREVQQLIRKVASTKATVLLLGESGAGKTLVARIIHELSERARFSFVKVNCAAIPDDLLESELFGHEKGAFTGAVDTKPGRVEEADNGSIFLDEIGELSMRLQAKLLRFLQEREFERLGSLKTRKVDVRIIAATNRDLQSAVAAGEFREDLFYRLNVFPIRVPPLRERMEDIYSLLEFLGRKMAREYGRTLKFTHQATQALTRYHWPGNVREMENLLERLAIMADGELIDADDLDPYLSLSSRTKTPTVEGAPDSLKDRERRDVVLALERNGWVQSRAARELGITLRQMGYRIKKFGLEEFCRRRKTV